jgi:hypothetical protein
MLISPGLSYCFKGIFLSILSILCFNLAIAQSWMAGYNYRKKITIVKTQVSGSINLIDFPVLISFTSEDLKFLKSLCNGNKISTYSGSDLSFASATASTVPIKFQLDAYNPDTGELSCWVKLSSLTASGSAAAANQLYLYYGSNITHKPYGASGLETWSNNYLGVWHMNPEDLGPRVRGGPGVSTANYVKGQIGTGINLNGTSSFISSGNDVSTEFNVSAWIKLNSLGTNHVIFTNDSLNRGGYKISVNANNHLQLDIYFSVYSNTFQGITALQENKWYYVNVSYRNGIKSMFVNGKRDGAVVDLNTKIGPGGNVIIGKSKQNNQFFNGLIDEIRLDRTEKSLDWITTEYRNQLDPASFFTVGANETNPVQILTGSVFNGSQSELWSNPLNWDAGSVPENFMNLTIKAGKSLIISGNNPVIINKLNIQSGASLLLQSDLAVFCNAILESKSSILFKSDSRFTINQNLINNGAIGSADGTGVLEFSGLDPYSVSGTGTIDVSHMEVNLKNKDVLVTLDSKISVSETLNLKSGQLNANGKLVLRAFSLLKSASILPVNDMLSASIKGSVLVEKFVSGNLPAPSSGRGWRLLSSPVYQYVTTSLLYDVLSLKNSLFITGAGGAKNGFDISPNNGGTVYTHDQSLRGTLAQKYIVMKDISTKIPFGKGIFLFSRGSRNVANAYSEQILTAPYKNPDPFILTFTGSLFFGDLQVPLLNSNYGEEGDGFNLLGNPYASAISWGKLIKQNVGPFVWLFDPLNNDYRVTDDPDAVITSGSGFFVKLISGKTDGSITFQERVKVSASNSLLTKQRKTTMVLPPLQQEKLNTSKLSVQISRDVFNQEYNIHFKPDIKEGVDQEDAQYIGSGYVTIASVNETKTKLAIESRPPLTEETTLKLSVTGWSAGPYQLLFKGIDSFEKGTKIVLTDHLLNLKKVIIAEGFIYPFSIDPANPLSQGNQRFSLTFDVSGTKNGVQTEPKGLAPVAYPNPFNDLLHLQTNSFNSAQATFLIRDFSGRIIWTSKVMSVKLGSDLQFSLETLPKGLYFLELLDGNKRSKYKSIKIIKQ